ncbi:hypothetical protein [Streptomyces sp. NBC_01435]|uniref:hypothetical protein n=1 Tax=Streptomyces sp. NBC_01435 TaxID=2903865 RepID=UPI002E31CD58|nr:hypothetical protein [Streptomyces sp. NBC_01435]
MDSPFRFLGNGPADEQPSVQPKSSASPPMDGEADDFEAAHDAVDFSSMNQQPEASAPGMQDSAPYEGPALDSGDSASGGHADDDHATPEDCHSRQEEKVSQERDALQQLLNHMGSEEPQTNAVVEPDERTPLGGIQEEAPGFEASSGRSESTSVRQSFGTNNGVAIGVQFQNIINGMRTVELRDDWVDQQLAVYVPPKNEKDAADKLRAEHVVVLLGESGAGRQPTGLRLLRGLDEELTLKRFHREPKDPFSLADLTGQQKVGWLLDLRAEGDTVSGGLGFSFQDTTALKTAMSYLVVLASPEVWEPISNGGGNVAVTLEAPEAMDVLLAHLRAAQCRMPEEWAADSRIAQAITGKLPGKVKRWSDAIMAEESRSVVATATSATNEQIAREFNERVERVIEAMADWRNQLRTWHIEHPDSGHRNFLLAAASMDRTPVDLIYRASESLANTLGEKPKPRPGQQGPGIIELTYMIGAELTADGTVMLPSDGYAEAVVEYFLMDRAHLVDRFTEWTATQAAKLKGSLGTQLADRVAVWVIRHTQKSRSVDVLKSVAGQWSSSKILKRHARDLLSVAAVDSEIGRLVRDGILVWARDDEAPESLLITLAGVCQQVSQVYPKEALLRLGELAASDKSAVTAAVGEAFNAMWDRPGQRHRVRKVLRTWARSSTGSLRRSSSHAFLYLASRVEENGAPSLLSAGNDYENDLPWIVQSWRTTLEYDPAPDTAVDAFKAWMEGAASVPNTRDAVFSILARAVHDAPEDNSAVRFLGLNRLATHWEPSEPRKPLTDRARFRDSLIDWVRAADPANPGTGSSVPKS